MNTAEEILVVEDDPILRDVLTENLGAVGYPTDVAGDGESAWRRLEREPRRYVAILLDRRLPGVDGLEILRRIKADPELSHIPVIMQTGMTEPEDILAGLRAGAHYYLTKPFTADTLLAIVDTAVRDFRQARALRQAANLASQSMRCLDRAAFRFRQPEQARDIAALLANTCPNPERVVLGLSELMLNAVEHGNLGISYREKSLLLDHDRLGEEIELRLSMPIYSERWASVEFERAPDEIRFLIVDQGQGFDWSRYLEIDPERAFDNHGRGIALARMLSFSRLEYQGVGNQVLAALNLGG